MKNKEMVKITDQELRNSFIDSKIVLQNHQNPMKYSEIFHNYMEPAINEALDDEQLLKKILDWGQLIWNKAVADDFPNHPKSKDIKTEIGVNVLEKKSIEEWFQTYAPNADYTIHPDLNITVIGDLEIYDATEEPDNLTVKGTKVWFLNDKQHREDGPAVEYPSGTKSWWLNGELHRTDGPATENNIGYKSWFINGKRHRVDGPAVEFGANKEWWLNDKKYTEEEYNKKLNRV